MKKYGQAKQIAFWLLLAALALAPFAGTAAASYTAGGGEVEDGVFYAIAIGTIDSRPPEVTGEYAIAIGASTKADGACGTAVGYFASAIGLYSSAYGQFVSAKGEGSVATGCEAQATGLYSAATGFEAEASGIRSSAYGAKAQAMGTGSLAAGSDAYAGGANGTAVGFSASAGGENSSAYGMGAYAQGTDSLAAGNGAGAVDANTTAVGASAVAKFEGSTAIGYKANATIAGSVALGAGSYANRTTTATGVYVPAGASGGGITATVKGTDKGVVSIGDATDVKGHVAFTRQLTALAAGIEDTDAVNVAQLKALDSVAVKYDNDTKTAVILNSGGAAVKLSNVADAELSDASTQAVTGKQLYAANQTIATNRTNIETNKASIETNKASIATNETKIASNTTNITANAAQLKALDDVAVKYDDTKTAVTLNSGGAAVKLSNVADAVLDNTSTQAVTGKQLYAANQTIATNRTNIETNKASIATNETKIASNTTNITTNTTGIKENKTAITAVSGDVATKYTALDGRIAANTNEIAAVSGDVATKYTPLDGRIAANEASINTVSGDVAAKYTDLGGRITANTNEIAAVSGDVATKYTTLDGRITANETNIATLDTRVTSHDTRIATNETNIASNTTNIGTLDTRVTSHDARIATNETNIAANTTSIGTLDTRVTSHDARIATNETNIASNTTSIGTLDTRVTSHDARIATNADAITTNKLSIDTVSGDVRMLDGRVKANTASINTVSADVAGLRGEITASGVKYDDDSKEVLTLNKGGAAVRLSNVADAELSDASTQAVTGKQLYETNQTINTVSGDVAAKYTVLDGRVAANETSINTVSGDVAALRGEIAASGIHYDDPSNSVVTLNKGGNAVRLTNIAAGTADSDAVNYGQLKALGGKVETFGETLAERIGGTYDPVTGEFTVTYPDGPTPANPAAQASASSAASAPSPASAQNAAQAAAQAASTPHLSETLQNMWDAIGAVQAGNVKAGDNIVVDGTKVSVSKTPEFERVKVGNIDIREEGIDMGGKPITGLAKGEIYDGSGDAVTGGQLWNAYRRIETIDERVQVVGAHAAALSAMHPVAYNPYEPTTLSAGVGYYRSEYSMAVGIFHYARENVLLNAGIAFNSDGDTMGRAGISFALGKSGRKQPSMIKDVAAMQRQMMEMQQVLTQLKEENEKNKDTIKELKDALKDKK